MRVTIHTSYFLRFTISTPNFVIQAAVLELMMHNLCFMLQLKFIFTTRAIEWNHDLLRRNILTCPGKNILCYGCVTRIGKLFVTSLCVRTSICLAFFRSFFLTRFYEGLYRGTCLCF